MHKPLVLGILASGRGSNLQSIIDAIDTGRIQGRIGVVISDKPEANALKRVAPLDIPAAAVDRKRYADKRSFEEALAAELERHHVDLVVLAGFMLILSPFFIQLFAGRIMNIHPSLLPAFPGRGAQRQAIDYGAKVSGCTVHFVDEGMDSGPIILQEAAPVLEGDDAAALAERILHLEHTLYPRAIGLYAEGRLRIEGRRVRILAEPKPAGESCAAGPDDSTS